MILHDHEIVRILTRIERKLDIMLGPQLTAAVNGVQTAATAVVTAEAALPTAVTDDQDVQNAITTLGAVATQLNTVASALQAMAPAPAAPATT